MNLSTLLKQLGGVAETMVPLLGGPAGAPAAIVGIAHSVQAAISAAKSMHSGPPSPEADKASADLFAAVSKHAASVFDRAEHG